MLYYAEVCEEPVRNYPSNSSLSLGHKTFGMGGDERLMQTIQNVLHDNCQKIRIFHFFQSMLWEGGRESMLFSCENDDKNGC